MTPEEHAEIDRLVSDLAEQLGRATWSWSWDEGRPMDWQERRSLVLPPPVEGLFILRMGSLPPVRIETPATAVTAAARAVAEAHTLAGAEAWL